MRAAAPALGLILLAAPAAADLNFEQITQAQTSAGAEGLFGKTWVEIRGSQMRLVSGYARKVPAKGPALDPRRRVQILDVKQRTRTVVDPAAKAYAVSALGPPDYGNGLGRVLERGAPEWKILSREVKLEKRPGVRRLLGADCERWRVTVTMRLSSLNGREEAARMDQSLWVAPLSGDLAKTLMELMAYENSYRAGTKAALSPLDHERYQVHEAAAYLRVPEAELARVVEAVREALRDLPSYPVASSVAWWRDEGRTVRPPQPAPAPQPEPAGVALGDIKPRQPQPAPTRPKPARRSLRRPIAPFRPINWRRQEPGIDGMIRQTRSEFGDFPLGALGEPRVSEDALEAARRPRAPRPQEGPRFEEELRKILLELIAQETAADPQAGAPSAAGPFFEIYAELRGLERPAMLSEGDFRLPEKYRKVDRLPGEAGR